MFDSRFRATPCQGPRVRRVLLLRKHVLPLWRFPTTKTTCIWAFSWAHVGLCTWEVEATKGATRNTFISTIESPHFARHGFHAGASAVEVCAFQRGIRMLAQPLARWLAAWAGLIGWLAGWLAGWLDWLGWLADVCPRSDDYGFLPLLYSLLPRFS